MTIARFVVLFIAAAFLLPACGTSSPTDLAIDDALPIEAAFDPGDEEEEEEDCVENEDGEIVCGGFLGSGS